ncbi:odorant receptor 22c-like [Rhopalosiphum maidis]|uniref:odorant receptor 22c-like n=1 Tax=Rhopalosiphum maidis TaxID=43146 RepID=UPI000F002332|nr:odorant receptor 22c-like [Rhopalosiphum maidis]XP_026804935.1 odorant receptor 22c-like [Rhopalosiphum maidis]XP_026804936.1 odorant receptor 22c-like [Rhopalosiphum maidis]XP_026804937.1 odorant receptor 22c-like [Rhopalosiphum maidis]XP_026804939.1 odorant receptor 22c-like [Rhopalosiphum maidis]
MVNSRRTANDDRTTAPNPAEKDADGDTVMDVELFKSIGMYQLLRPAECGLNSRRCRMAALVVVALTLGLQSMQVCRLYLARHDFQMFANMGVLVINGLMCLLKGYMVVANADRMCATLEATRYAFTGCGGRDPSELRRCRATLSAILRTFVALSFGTLFVWVLIPWFMASEYDDMPTVWAVVYVVESIILTVNVFCWTSFDCYLVTMCFVFDALFRTMSTGYETLGRCRSSASKLSARQQFDTVATISKASISDDNYDDLTNHILDNKNIIEQYDAFFDVVRPMVLIQIADGSYSIITLIFLTSLAYIKGYSIVSAPILKFVCGLASLTIELYIYCYGFNHIEDGKSTVNFGLYSSNWTEMDLKFKKTLLLAMTMNSAHKRVMKVSPNSIVNLEMFSRVMNMSYSIVSVLLNY